MDKQQFDLFWRRGSDEGRRQRDMAKQRLASANGQWLERARRLMVEAIREQGFCSSDDCWKRCPPPADAHPSVMGCLFDDPRFVRVGDRLSDRASARKRRISTYELKEEL